MRNISLLFFRPERVKVRHWEENDDVVPTYYAHQRVFFACLSQQCRADRRGRGAPPRLLFHTLEDAIVARSRS